MKNRSGKYWLIVPLALLLSGSAYAQGSPASRLGGQPPTGTLTRHPSPPPSRFVLILDGEPCGYLKSVSGGTPRTPIALRQPGPGTIQRQPTSALSYEPLTMVVGLGMGKGMYEWISAAFSRGQVAKSGVIHACSANSESMSERHFVNALIEEITMPALDGASKEPGYMTIKLAPEQIVVKPGTGKRIQVPTASSQKQWLCSNFRVQIEGLPCSRVTKVEALTWKIKVIRDEVGSSRVPTLRPSGVEVPNLKLTIATADIQPWQDWYRSFAVGGQQAEGTERTGSIVYLAPDRATELFRMHLAGLRPVSLRRVPTEANKDPVARFTVELYCEQMRFAYAGTQ